MNYVTKINKIIFSVARSIEWKNINKPNNLKPEHHIANDLYADSLDKIEMLMMLEEAFDTEVPDDTAEKWVTVGDVYKYFEA